MRCRGHQLHPGAVAGYSGGEPGKGQQRKRFGALTFSFWRTAGKRYAETMQFEQKQLVAGEGRSQKKGPASRLSLKRMKACSRMCLRQAQVAFQQGVRGWVMKVGAVQTLQQGRNFSATASWSWGPFPGPSDRGGPTEGEARLHRATGACRGTPCKACTAKMRSHKVFLTTGSWKRLKKEDEITLVLLCKPLQEGKRHRKSCRHGLAFLSSSFSASMDAVRREGGGFAEPA